MLILIPTRYFKLPYKYPKEWRKDRLLRQAQRPPSKAGARINLF